MAVPLPPSVLAKYEPGYLHSSNHPAVHEAELAPQALLEVLERALAKGRRQVPIVAIAKELELSRDEVLAWVKSNASRVPELAKQYPPDPYEKVATVRLTERPEVDRREGRAPRGYDDDANYDSQTSYLKNAPGAKHVPKGMPAYKAYTKTRLGSNNVATQIGRASCRERV